MTGIRKYFNIKTVQVHRQVEDDHQFLKLSYDLVKRGPLENQQAVDSKSPLIAMRISYTLGFVSNLGSY